MKNYGNLDVTGSVSSQDIIVGYTLTGNVPNISGGSYVFPYPIGSEGQGLVVVKNDDDELVLGFSTVSTSGGGGGTSGYSGRSGYSGFSGTNGATGTSGFSGFSGTGLSGFSGFSGATGTGTSGFSGFSGTNGATGISGFSGFSGTNGSIGISGFSGYAGTPGVTGNGVSGYLAIWTGISGITDSEKISETATTVEIVAAQTNLTGGILQVFTNTGYTELKSTTDGTNQTYLDYDHSDGTVVMNNEILASYPMFQINDNTAGETGAEQVLKVITNAGKALYAGANNDIPATEYVAWFNSVNGHASSVKATVGAGAGTAPIIKLIDQRSVSGYSIDASGAGKSLFTGVEFKPQSGSASTSGSATTLWIDSSTGKLMKGNVDLQAGGAGTITGTISSDQVAVGNGTPSISGSNSLTWSVANGLSANRSGALRNEMFGGIAGKTTMTGTDNTAVGYSALTSGPSGSSNTAVGSSALALCTVEENTAIGAGSGDAITTATRVTAIGYNALGTLSTGTPAACTAVGWSALSACTGLNNTAIGSRAGVAISTGQNNTAIGQNTLQTNTTSGNNTAVGAQALSAVTGNSNTAVGTQAGDAIAGGSRNTTIGSGSLGAVAVSDNTACGFQALLLATGSEATAVGSNALDALTSGLRNTAVGFNSLSAITTAANGTAVGHSALGLATGAENTAVGALAGDAIVSGASNTLVGANAGGAIIDGNFNAAIGDSALFLCTSGVSNVGLGTYACYSVSSGSNNLGIGTNAVANVSTTSNNVGVGYGALQYTTVTAQVAIGMEALRGDLTPANNTGAANVAVGFQSLRVNNVGAENVAIGYQSLTANTSGSRCVSIGTGALAVNLSGSDNTGLGWAAGDLCTSGSGNIFLGSDAGDSTAATASNRFVVGSVLAAISNVFIGNGETSGTPQTDVVFGVTGGSGLNSGATNHVIAGGISTGSGPGGTVSIQTSPSSASSSTPNTLAEAARFDASTVAGNTRFMLYDVDNGTLERVTVGAADSGGAGFKVLRIPN